MERTDWLGIRLGMLWALRRAGLPVAAAHRVLLGRRIGSGFRIGRGSCVIGRNLGVGRNVSVGKNTDIAAEEILLEDDVSIGSNVTIRCKRLVMRRGSRIDSHSTVYGIATPGSALEMGEFAWIFSFCHLNTDEAIRIGDRTAAGSHCLIFTHSSYLPITQGYPVTVAPVVVGEDVWLPWHAFILPGARIGRGSTVGAFSLVAGEVPEYSLAVGVPARVVKDAQTYRRKYSNEALAELCEKITQNVVHAVAGAFRPRSLFFPKVRSVEKSGPGCWRLREGTEEGRVVLLPQARDRLAEYVLDPKSTVFVTSGSDGPPAPGCNWCDLVTQRSSLPLPLPRVVSEALSNFSRYGIRFAWHSK